ncbi:MAG: NAD(P)-dependent malic enzyme [Pyramidobacter sp.]|jgi:malate dehydrogenase (oxaloacetate-decarboxylating)
MAEKSIYEIALERHKETVGKFAMVGKMPVTNMQELAVAYTPGVAEPCRAISKNPDDVYTYTSKSNVVAVITDGSAVLGLGNIGAKAAIPVMEGKCCLFKNFAGIDAIPLCLETQDTDEIVNIVKNLTATLGGINLEDIAAPRCFEVEERLKALCDIPVFHDDQHGTAVILLAAVINALKVVGKKIGDVKIILNGAGAAGTAISKILLQAGAKNIIALDSKGALSDDMDLSPAKLALAKITNPGHEKGTLAQVIKGADVFLGTSVGGALKPEMVKSMAPKAIIFAMANPVPEIFPDEAKAAGAAVVGTGRSDFPNQVNNCLGFPGIFRGALDCRATQINDEMKLAAAYALASLIPDDELSADHVIVDSFDKRVVPAVAAAVAEAARKTGVARL